MNNMIKKENANPAVFGSVVDQIFQNNLSRFFDDDFWGGNSFPAARNQAPVNIRETDKSYELQLIAPGLKKQDFNLNLAGDALTVSYDHIEESSDGKKSRGWLRQEYSRRSFSRSFNLGDSVDAGNVIARYEDGILHLSIPKKETSKTESRTIPVQ